MIEILIVVLLIVLVLAPFVLIGIGIYRCHDSNGFIFFMIGAGLLSSCVADLLSDFIGQIICRILMVLGFSATLSDNRLIFGLLWSLFMFFSFRLFKYIESKKTKAELLNIRNTSISQLTQAIASLLNLDLQQIESLQKFTTLFTEAVCNNNTLTIKDIDEFIDWLYVSGFVVPSFDQYRSLGMHSTSSQSIYVPPETEKLFDDWTAFKNRALDAGIMLTRNPSSPNVKSWHDELCLFLPGLFEPEETDHQAILERIIHIAEEGMSEQLSLPAYAVLLAEIDHPSERDSFRALDNNLEELLRSHSQILCIPAEDGPTELIDILKRRMAHKDRLQLVHDARIQALISNELASAKQRMI